MSKIILPGANNDGGHTEAAQPQMQPFYVGMPMSPEELHALAAQELDPADYTVVQVVGMNLTATGQGARVPQGNGLPIDLPVFAVTGLLPYALPKVRGSDGGVNIEKGTFPLPPVYRVVMQKKALVPAARAAAEEADAVRLSAMLTPITATRGPQG